MEDLTRSILSGTVEGQPKFNALQSVANVLRKNIEDLKESDLDFNTLGEAVKTEIIQNFGTLEQAKQEMSQCIASVIVRI